jgi:hypothetical protein
MTTKHRTDRNLFFHVRREKQIGRQTRENYISPGYRWTGLFNNEISVTPYPESVPGQDENLFFRVEAVKQPTLRKRVFKDLEPQSRVIGALDLTKKQRQVTSIVKGIQEVRRLLHDFLSAPKIGADGAAILDPITGDPVFEVRSLQQILIVSHGLLFALLQQNNVVLTNSFTSNSVQSVLKKIEASVGLAGDSQADRSRVFKNAILEERLKNLEDINETVEESVQEATAEQKIPSSWEDSDAKIFETNFFSEVDWKALDPDTGEPVNKIAVNGLVASRTKNHNITLRSVNNTAISMGMMGLQFSKKHWLNLDTLKFQRERPKAENIKVRR